MELTRESLIAHLVSEYGLDEADVRSDTLLFSSGRLDSFVLVELVFHLEQQTSRKIDPIDFTLDNLDSVDRILAFLSRRES